MEKKEISTLSPFVFAFRAIVGNFYLLFPVFLFYLILETCFLNSDYLSRADSSLLQLIVYFFEMLLFCVIFFSVDLGVRKLSLNLYDKGPCSINPVFSYFYLLPKIFIAWTLYYSGVIVMNLVTIHWALHLLLIFSVVYLASRFYFFPYFILENSSVISSFRKSFYLTEGHVFNTIIFLFITGIFYFIAKTFHLGTAIYPILLLSQTYFYRKLIS